MELDITKIVEEIAMKAKENQEEFIFESIYPYCEDVLQIKVNKEELKQILLNGMQKQQPCEEEDLNCTECRYYDKEKHHCPRFCQVIENTVAEITSEQTRWIPVSEKPQKGRYLCTYEYHGDKFIDFGSFDGDVWYVKPIAYMPLPEPYGGEEE